jgi:hypothetical protein
MVWGGRARCGLMISWVPMHCSIVRTLPGTISHFHLPFHLYRATAATRMYSYCLVCKRRLSGTKVFPSYRTGPTDCKTSVFFKYCFLEKTVRLVFWSLRINLRWLWGDLIVSSNEICRNIYKNKIVFKVLNFELLFLNNIIFLAASVV